VAPIRAACSAHGVGWLPDFHRLSGGRLHVMCGAYLHGQDCESPNPTAAWDELAPAGPRTRRRLSANARAYALCPARAKDPPGVDKNAARALGRRKRR
jgi:hypothetical protein